MSPPDATGAASAAAAPAGRSPGLGARARGAAANNVGALVATQGLTAGLRFGSNLILTRLLAPEAFGVMLMITSVSYILTMLTETGVSPYIVRSERGADDDQLDTLWTINVIRGLLIAGIVVLAAPAIAGLAGKPETALPLQVAALGFAVQGCVSLGPFVALRRHQAAKNVWVTLGAYCVSLPVMIGLVWWTGSYWGLVAGYVLGSCAHCASSYLFYPDARHRFDFDTGVALSLWRFARFILASSLTTVVVMQFDKLFVLASFSLAGAGLYAIASNLAAVPTQFGDAYYMKVYMPQASERLRAEALTWEAFYRPMRLVRPLLVFACAAGITFGERFVALIFPADYAQAGAFLSVLVVKPMLEAVCKPTSMILVSNHMARTRFVGDCLRMAWIVVAAVVGWRLFGVWGLLWAVALTDLLPLLYQYTVMARLGVVRAREEAPVLGAGLAGAGVGWLLTQGVNAAF